ncbi:hypothetical protein NDU88_000409 [Pleurodeles waltl]|uniref:Uncharacterized protein n=1 Tax=Pleurodeles waltl TaxID=8319 RepID=A0AAV7P438_PLEWA|nr:hypothetical protein NDU88_000409 [Pleurodeles waltl]
MPATQRMLSICGPPCTQQMQPEMQNRCCHDSADAAQHPCDTAKSTHHVLMERMGRKESMHCGRRRIIFPSIWMKPTPHLHLLHSMELTPLSLDVIRDWRHIDSSDASLQLQATSLFFVSKRYCTWWSM